MSKFFNETQNAYQAARKERAASDLDIRQMLELVKQSDVVATRVVEKSEAEFSQVAVDIPKKQPLVLRRMRKRKQH